MDDYYEYIGIHDTESVIQIMVFIAAALAVLNLVRLIKIFVLMRRADLTFGAAFDAVYSPVYEGFIEYPGFRCSLYAVFVCTYLNYNYLSDTSDLYFKGKLLIIAVCIILPVICFNRRKVLLEISRDRFVHEFINEIENRGYAITRAPERDKTQAPKKVYYRPSWNGEIVVGQLEGFSMDKYSTYLYGALANRDEL